MWCLFWVLYSDSGIYVSIGGCHLSVQLPTTQSCNARYHVNVAPCATIGANWRVTASEGDVTFSIWDASPQCHLGRWQISLNGLGLSRTDFAQLTLWINVVWSLHFVCFQLSIQSKVKNTFVSCLKLSFRFESFWRVCEHDRTLPKSFRLGVAYLRLANANKVSKLSQVVCVRASRAPYRVRGRTLIVVPHS